MTQEPKVPEVKWTGFFFYDDTIDDFEVIITFPEFSITNFYLLALNKYANQGYRRTTHLKNRLEYPRIIRELQLYNIISIFRSSFDENL